jgi:hypothetical protein
MPSGGSVGSGGSPGIGGSTTTGGSARTGGTAGAAGSLGSGGTTGTGGATAAGGTGGPTWNCAGVEGLWCGAGEFCDTLPGECRASDTVGICVANIQGACPEIDRPVCGCDGRTYSNDCVRQLAGMPKQSDGACPAPDAGAGGSGGTGGGIGAGGAAGTGGAGGSTGRACAGIIVASCAVGEFCELPSGSCNADAAGTCAANAVVECLAISRPVCGCDGRTYSNDCTRRKASVSKRSDGPCSTADAGTPTTPTPMTPTLPAACQVDGDCCVVVDSCFDEAYLVGRAEYAAMQASIPSVGSDFGRCLSCFLPAVQVQCKGGFCVGAEIPPPYSLNIGPLTTSHCGYVNISDAGVPTLSPHALVDAGASQSAWGCRPPQ